MPLTPEDVSNKRFTPVRLREGYDMGEVDQFLDEVEAELARLTKENEDLRAKLSAAQLEQLLHFVVHEKDVFTIDPNRLKSAGPAAGSGARRCPAAVSYEPKDRSEGRETRTARSSPAGSGTPFS